MPQKASKKKKESIYKGRMNFIKKESFDELCDDHFSALTLANRKDPAAHKRDLDFARRLIQARLELIYKNSEGLIDWEAEIKRVNREFFLMRPVKEVDRAIEAGRHKGYFKNLLGMNKQRILSDYRLSLLYLISMEAMLTQKAYFLRRYMREKNLPLPLKIPTEKIPSEHYFKDRGLNYWTAFVLEALNETARNVVILRRGCIEALESNNMVRYVSNDGEALYALSGPMNIQPGKKDRMNLLRAR
jgi:hypothetical protein